MSVRARASRGVVQAGQIRLLEPITLADGTLVEVTITVPTTNDEARERQRILLREGLHLGGPPYPTREELHDR